MATSDLQGSRNISKAGERGTQQDVAERESESSVSRMRPGIRVAMSVSESFVSPCVEGGRDSSGRVLEILP